MSEESPLYFDALLNNEEFKKKLDEMADGIDSFTVSAMSTSEAIEKTFKKTGEAAAANFSDSAKEIENYKKSITGDIGSGPLVPTNTLDNLKNQLSDLISAKSQIAEFFNSGKISADKYRDSIEKLTESESRLKEAISISEGQSSSSIQPSAKAPATVLPEYDKLIKSGLEGFIQLDEAMQKNILRLHSLKKDLIDVSEAQKTLAKEQSSGTITAKQFADTQAALTFKERAIKDEINSTALALKGSVREVKDYDQSVKSLKDTVLSFIPGGEALNASLQKGASVFGHIKNIVSGYIGNLTDIKAKQDAAKTATEAAAAAKSALAAGTITAAEAEVVYAAAKTASNAATAAGTVGLRAFRIALISTGIGAIVVLLGSLISYFTSTQEGIDKVTRALEPLKVAFRMLLGAAQNLGKWLVDAFTNPKKAMSDLGDFVKNQLINRFSSLAVILDGIINLDFKKVSNGVLQMTTGVEDVIGKTGRSLKEVKKLGSEIAELKIKRDKESATDDLEIARLNRLSREKSEIARDTSKSKSERTKAGNEALAAINKKLQLENNAIELNKKIMALENSQKGKTNAMIKAENDLLKQQEENKARAAQERSRITSSINNANRNNEVNATENLYKKIAEIRAKYEVKSQSKAESPIGEINKEFDKLTAEIIKHNSNPANKLKMIDLKQVELDRKKAIDSIKEVQAADDYKKELEVKKQLYSDYENYKSKVGEALAKERYGKEINTEKNHLQYLESERKKLLEKGKLSGVDKDTLANLDERILSASKVLSDNRDKEFLSAFEAAKTHSQKLIEIEDEYQKHVIALGKSATEEQIKALKKLKKTKENALEDDKIKESSVFKALFEDIEEKSNHAVQVVIADAKRMLKALLTAGKISPELAKELEQQINALSKSLEERAPKSLINLAGELNNIADAVGDINSQFGRMIHTVADVVGNLGNMKTHLIEMSTANKKGDLLGSLSSGIGLFTAGLTIMKSIGSIFDKSEEDREKQRYATEFQIKAIEAQSKAMERQLSLIKDLYGIERVSKYGEAIDKMKESSIKAKNELSKMFQLTGNQTIDELISKWNETFGDGWKGIDRSQFNHLWDSGQLNQFKIAIDNLEELQRLLDEGKLDEKASALARTILDLSAKEKEAANAIKEVLTGTGYQEIGDGIFDAIVSGATSGAESFKSIMRKAMLSSLKSGEYAKELQKFYDKFAEANKNGLDKVEIEELKSIYDFIYSKTKAEMEALEKITGISMSDIFSGTSYQEIGDGIFDAIVSGATSGAESFNSIMRKAMIQNLKSGEYANEMQKLNDELAEANKNGLDKDEIEELRSKYEAIYAKTKAEMEALEKITGISLSEKSDTNNGRLPGAIYKELSEQTGSELLGIERASYELTKKKYDAIVEAHSLNVDSNQILKKQLLHLSNIDRNTERSADNTERLKSMEDNLILIAKNTAPSQSSRSLGI